MNNKNIIRTAAIVFSEENTTLKSSTVQRKIIESIFVEKNNKELSINHIIDELKRSLNMDFDYDEVKKIIEDHKKSKFELRLDTKQNEYLIKLEIKRFETLKERETIYSLEPQIIRFITEKYEGVLSPERINKLLHRYFYELLNKNIDTFKKISNPKNKTENLFIDPNIFDLEEREAINAFLIWDDSQKNKSIFALISYSLEYAVVNNHYESASLFLNSIKNKIFYLDNNVLYRAIGLNGEDRQKRILTFIEKCQKSGQKFKISKYSEKEFKDTVKHNVKLLQKVPFKKINYNLFSKYSLSPSIYEYYHRWKANRSTYSFDLFTSHIFSELENFNKKYNVEIDYKIPYDESGKKELKIIENYKNEIASAKGYGNDQSHQFDAINTFFIEKLRGSNCYTITDTKYFFVSTDQKLRKWDFSRNDFQPIALIPSQWMAILLKYFSRTDDDYASFISFLTLKTNQPIIDEDDLQNILSGISEITEDFKKQETILDKMVELKFEGILNGTNNAETVYKKSIDFVKREFESEIDLLNIDKTITSINFSNEKISFKKQLLLEKETTYNDLIKQKKPIDKVAESNNNKFKVFFALILIAYYLVLLFLTIKFGWNIMEPITYFFGVIGVIGVLLYTMIVGKDLNPITYFEKRKEDTYIKFYSQFHFNVERFENMNTEILDLKNEIETLEKEHNSTFPNKTDKL